MSYYRIVKSNNILLNDNELIIDGIELLKNSSPITNDVEFNNAIHDAGYFLLSGGGTYIINGRYLVVIERAKNARVNPQKISIFTGRSDSIEEILNPRMLLRELFEELLVYDESGKLLYPRSEEYQDIIDSVYNYMWRVGVIKAKKSDHDLRLSYIKAKKRICIGDVNYELDFHVNRKRDINVLFLFDVRIDGVNGISIRDGEYHMENEKRLFHNRNIMLLDIMNDILCDQDGNKIRKFERTNASEHLIYILNTLKQRG